MTKLPPKTPRDGLRLFVTPCWLSLLVGCHCYESTAISHPAFDEFLLSIILITVSRIMSKTRKRSRAEVAAAVTENNNKSQGAAADDDFVLGSSLPSLWNDPTLHTTTTTSVASSVRTAPRNSSSASSSNNSTLFGRVMQSASKHGSDEPDDNNSAITKQQPGHASFQTPTKKAKKAKRPLTGSFLSPGGFKLRNAVEAASPFAAFAFHDNSNSALSAAPPKPAWRQTTTTAAYPWDWALKEKLVLQSPAFSNTADWRWMQRTLVVGNNQTNNQAATTTTTRQQHQWQQARTYWQYPHNNSSNHKAMTSAPMDTTTSTASRFPMNDWIHSSHSVLQQQQMEPSKGTTALQTEKVTPSEMACQQLQMYNNGHNSNHNDTMEKEWPTAFWSVFQTWRMGSIPYFYSRGTDHTIVCSNNNNKPQVLISSCNRQFRTWCQTQGITLYVSSGTNNKEWNEAGWKEEQQKSDLSSKHGNHPPSPEAAAELAALRRASVFGKTVGADVSVSFRAKGAVQNIALQRRVWQQVPALQVYGMDACAAVAEYYVNTRGQIAGPLQRWPVLLACQPFCHATLQHATVRFAAAGKVHVQGLLLPDKVQSLVQTVVDCLQVDDDDEEEEATHVTLQVTCTAAKASANGAVRPLDDVVIGQPNLWALVEDEEEAPSPDVVTQITWDNDEPDGFSYKVTPGVA